MSRQSILRFAAIPPAPTRTWLEQTVDAGGCSGVTCTGCRQHARQWPLGRDHSAGPTAKLLIGAVVAIGGRRRFGPFKG